MNFSSSTIGARAVLDAGIYLYLAVYELFLGHIFILQISQIHHSSQQHEQEKPTNCGTKTADVLDKFLAGKL